MRHHIEDDQLLAFATDRLEPLDAEAVRRHVADCPVCARRLRETETVCSHLPIESAVSSVGFEARLRQQLDEIDARSASPWWRRAGGFGLVPAAAAAVLAGAGLWFIGSSEPEPSARPPPAVVLSTAEPELLADLALLEDLDAVELVDVVDDLDAIARMPDEEGG